MNWLKKLLTRKSKLADTRFASERQLSTLYPSITGLSLGKQPNISNEPKERKLTVEETFLEWCYDNRPSTYYMSKVFLDRFTAHLNLKFQKTISLVKLEYYSDRTDITWLVKDDEVTKTYSAAILHVVRQTLWFQLNSIKN